MVASYLDILTSRRIWAHEREKVDDLRVLKPFAASLAHKIRHTTVPELTERLHKMLEYEPAFANHTGPTYTGFYPDTRWLLARLTDFVQLRVDGKSIFDELNGNEYQIDHLWPQTEDANARGYDTSEDFSDARNQIGCLVLLRSSVNQSIQDMPYEEKVSRYARENILAQTLYENTYQNNPGLRRFREESGLPFRHHVQFNRDDLVERQELYQRLAERVWSPERIDEAASS